MYSHSGEHADLPSGEPESCGGGGPARRGRLRPGAGLMRYRLFGSSGLRVSELFLGAMTFGEQGGVGAGPEECRRILDAYADAGGNVIDTAINYRGGASEEILGELLAGRRDRFVVATKYTVSRDRDDPNAAGNHRKNLRLSLETTACAGCAPATSTSTGCTCGIATPRPRRPCVPSMMRSGRARSSTSASPTPPRGSPPGRTHWRSGTAGRLSRASRCPTACCSAISNVNCCRWPRPWA